MTDLAHTYPPRASVLEIARTASPFALLQQALRRQKQLAELPPGLRADLGLCTDNKSDSMTTMARYR